ncbi:hypothetical protein V8F33_005499 [Rhypophila sp. PSN 637]
MLTNPLSSLLLLLTTALLYGQTNAAALSPAHVLKRENKELRGGGTITGTFDDQLTTYGLSTCPGIAAIGVAGNPSTNIMKIVTHVFCDSNVENYLSEFKSTFHAASLISPSIALSVVNPAKFPEGKEAQTIINMLSFRAAADVLPPNEKWRILHYERQTLEGGEDEGGGELQISNGNPAIIADGHIHMNPNPPLPFRCSWPFRYLLDTASDEEAAAGLAEANQICVDAPYECPGGQGKGCNVGVFEGECSCHS